MMNRMNAHEIMDNAVLLNTVRMVSNPELPMTRKLSRERVKEALAAIAEAAPDNEEDWDGALWYERLRDTRKDSLAERLTHYGPPKEIALEWLKTKY